MQPSEIAQSLVSFAIASHLIENPLCHFRIKPIKSARHCIGELCRIADLTDFSINDICAVAICLNDDELKQMSWSTFVAGCVQYPELVLYLKERRIFVNEPVTAEAEV